jgi:hypothetical protein
MCAFLNTKIVSFYMFSLQMIVRETHLKGEEILCCGNRERVTGVRISGAFSRNLISLSVEAQQHGCKVSDIHCETDCESTAVCIQIISSKGIQFEAI